MSILFALIPLTLLLVAAAGWAFVWAVGSGQFDELDSPAWEILCDDAISPEGREPTGPAKKP